MIKRTIYIGSSSYLKSKNRQLIIENRDTGESSSIPFDDIGVLELDNPQILLNNSTLKFLSQENIITIICDEFHNPTSMLLPIVGNTLQSKRFRSQYNSKEPLKKNLWQTIIKSKIHNQSEILNTQDVPTEILKSKIKKVMSGDSTNMEAQAAQYYWKNIFNIDKFTRERYGDYPNNMLNYTYAILRSITCRALVGAGLHPSIGLFHKNQYNPFCLADDLMEPFRPFADRLVLENYKKYKPENNLTKDQKRILLEISYLDVKIENKTRPLMIAVGRMAESLAKSFEEKKNLLITPCLIE